MVRVVGHDGRSSTMELQKALEATELPLRHVDVIRYLDDSGTIDLSALSSDLIERDLSKHIEKQLVTSLGDLPRTRKFYGREKEIENMVNLLEHQSGSILVPGIAGIGKTALSAKLIERFTHRRNLLYHRCQDWDGARAFLEAMGEWMSAMGSDDLSDYLASTPVPQPQMAVNLIADGLEGAPSLMQLLL